MKLNYKYSKVYWFFKDLSWMKVYFSPFKFFLPKLYIGKIAIPTPWFYPRTWVKATPERAHKATKQYIDREESYNKMNPNYAREIKSYDEIFQEKMKFLYSVDKKVGVDFVSLGWKTKWDDYRFEWNPIWSVVFFGYQIALIFQPEHDMHYWEMFLCYSKETNKRDSIKNRIKRAKELEPCVWTSTTNNIETKTCYWDLILKNKYL